MDKILAKNSLANLLQQNGKIDVGERSVSSGLFEQPMKLIGFVPYNEFDILAYYKPQIDMNSEVVFTPYRVRLPNIEVTLPVMKEIRKVSENESFMMDRNVVTPYGTKGLIEYYHALERDDVPDDRKIIILVNIADRVLRQVKTSFPHFLNRLKLGAKGHLEYFSSPEELVSKRTFGDYTVVSNCFLCLCAYTNAVTGRPCYSLFDPEDIYNIEDANKDE